MRETNIELRLPHATTPSTIETRQSTFKGSRASTILSADVPGSSAYGEHNAGIRSVQMTPVLAIYLNRRDLLPARMAQAQLDFLRPEIGWAD